MIKWKSIVIISVIFMIIANIYLKSDDHRFPPNAQGLIIAIRNENDGRALELIRRGLGKTSFNDTDGNYIYYPIHEAASKGRAKILEALLKSGADPNQRDRFGYTPIHRLCDLSNLDNREENQLCLNLLVEYGANMNAAAENGNNALHLSKRDVWLTELFLSMGVSPNHQNREGNTPLHLACKGFYPDSVASLLLAGADISIPNKKGQSPEELATLNPNDIAARIIKRYKNSLLEQNLKPQKK